MPRAKLCRGSDHSWAVDHYVDVFPDQKLLALTLLPLPEIESDDPSALDQT